MQKVNAIHIFFSGKNTRAQGKAITSFFSRAGKELSQGNCRHPMKRTSQKPAQSGKRKAGRPKGSKNKPKTVVELFNGEVIENPNVLATAPVEKRKPGRPKGAKNKKSDKLNDAQEMMRQVQKRKLKRQQRGMIDHDSDTESDSYASVPSIHDTDTDSGSDDPKTVEA